MSATSLSSYKATSVPNFIVLPRNKCRQLHRPIKQQVSPNDVSTATILSSSDQATGVRKATILSSSDQQQVSANPQFCHHPTRQQMSARPQFCHHPIRQQVSARPMVVAVNCSWIACNLCRSCWSCSKDMLRTKSSRCAPIVLCQSPYLLFVCCGTSVVVCACLSIATSDRSWCQDVSACC